MVLIPGQALEPDFLRVPGVELNLLLVRRTRVAVRVSPKLQRRWRHKQNAQAEAQAEHEGGLTRDKAF